MNSRRMSLPGHVACMEGRKCIQVVDWKARRKEIIRETKT
jgi:hypothetical protein